MPSPKSILLLGLGELGTALLSALHTHKTTKTPSPKLTVLLRPSTLSSPSQTKATQLNTLKAQGIHFLPADILTLTLPELTTLFQPFDTVISALGFASPEGGLQVKITKAVLEVGVQWYVPWQFGVDYEGVGWASEQPVWDEQLVVRGLLRDHVRDGGRTKWIIVSTGIFTSFLFEGAFGVVEKRGNEVVVRALGGWENGVTVTMPGDIGGLTADIVFAENEEEVENQVLYTAGETVTYGGIAEVVESEIAKWDVGLKVKREVWSVEKLKGDLDEGREDNIKRYRVVFAKGDGVSWDKGKTWNVRKEIETLDVKGWVEENLRAKFGV